MRLSTITIRRSKNLDIKTITNVIDNSEFPFSVKTYKDDLIITVADNTGRTIRLEANDNLKVNLNNFLNGKKNNQNNCREARRKQQGV